MLGMYTEHCVIYRSLHRSGHLNLLRTLLAHQHLESLRPRSFIMLLFVSARMIRVTGYLSEFTLCNIFFIN